MKGLTDIIEREKHIMYNTISMQEAEDMIKSGRYFAADLHVHSWHSPDVVNHTDMSAYRLKEKGDLKGINCIITDHDTIESYENRKPASAEFNIKHDFEVHSCVYFMTDKDFSRLSSLAKSGNISGFARYCNQHNLPFVYNHPLRKIDLREWDNLEPVKRVARHFPILEWNLHNVKEKNEMILSIAEELEKPVIANSDTHTGDVGRVFTIAQGDNLREFFYNVMNNPEDTYLVLDSLDHDYLKEEAMELINQTLDSGSTISEGANFTEINWIDNLIYIAGNDKLMEYSLVRSTTKLFMKGMVFSGILNSMYVQSEVMKSRLNVPAINEAAFELKLAHTT